MQNVNKRRVKDRGRTLLSQAPLLDVDWVGVGTLSNKIVMAEILNSKSQNT